MLVRLFDFIVKNFSIMTNKLLDKLNHHEKNSLF